MRRALITTALMLAALLVLAPMAMAKPAPDGPKTEHGVNRDKLEAKAKKVVEERNGITVSRIASCGPVKKHGRPNYGKWICGWRAAGLYPGQVPYACAGKARWKRKSAIWIVDKCVNQRQPEAPLLDSPNPPPVFGFNDNWIFQTTPALNMLQDSGATVARTSLSWRGVEGEGKGRFNWYGSDQLYQHLLDRGIRPLWVLIDAPCWAQASPQACTNGKGELHPDVDHYDDFADFAALAAERYPQSVGFEVWNEPNYPLYWGGPPEPNDYAKMLKTVGDALHTVPGTTVVSAGLSPHSDNDTSGAVGFRDFLISMFESGAVSSTDAIGIHPYPGVGPDQDYVADVRVYLGKIQNVLQRYNATSIPLWATEFGASTTGDHPFTEDQQAKALGDLYDLFRHVDGIQMAIVHRFVESPELGGREGGFGVVSKNLVPKPAYCALLVVRGVSSSDC